MWAHRTLDDVGVELDATIVEEAGEAVPVPEAVADDPGCIRSAREPRREQLLEMLAASPRRVGIGDSRRVGSAPGPVITRDRPEVAGLGLAELGRASCREMGAAGAC